MIGKVEDEPEDSDSPNNFIPKGPKIAPIAEIPSFGVPSPGENPNEGGYEFSSGIFSPNKDCGYSSISGGYGYSSGY